MELIFHKCCHELFSDFEASQLDVISWFIARKNPLEANHIVCTYSLFSNNLRIYNIHI